MGLLGGHALLQSKELPFLGSESSHALTRQTRLRFVHLSFVCGLIVHADVEKLVKNICPGR